jgi:hypothetical protein
MIVTVAHNDARLPSCRSVHPLDYKCKSMNNRPAMPPLNEAITLSAIDLTGHGEAID